jgi:Domain of unknown function (DUF1858)
LIEVFVNFGFTMLINPQLRSTMARVVTLERACRRMGVALPEFLEALNSARDRLRGRPGHEPVAVMHVTAVHALDLART